MEWSDLRDCFLRETARVMILGNINIFAILSAGAFLMGCEFHPIIVDSNPIDSCNVTNVTSMQAIYDGLFNYCVQRNSEKTDQMWFTFYRDVLIPETQGWAEGWIDDFIDEPFLDFERRTRTVHLVNQMDENFNFDNIHPSVAAVHFMGGKYDFSRLSICPHVKYVVADCEIVGSVAAFASRFPNVEVLSMHSISDLSTDAEDLLFLRSFNALEMLCYSGPLQVKNVDSIIEALLENKNLRRIVILTDYETRHNDNGDRQETGRFSDDCETDYENGNIFETTNIDIKVSRFSGEVGYISISSASGDVVKASVNEEVNLSHCQFLYLDLENVIPEGLERINSAGSICVFVDLTTRAADCSQ